MGEKLPHGKMRKVSFQSAISRERLITNKIPLANTFFSPFLTHGLNLNKIGDLTAVTICGFGVDWSFTLKQRTGTIKRLIILPIKLIFVKYWENFLFYISIQLSDYLRFLKFIKLPKFCAYLSVPKHTEYRIFLLKSK